MNVEWNVDMNVSDIEFYDEFLCPQFGNPELKREEEIANEMKCHKYIKYITLKIGKEN